MHTLVQKFILALSLGLFFTIVHASPPIPIVLEVPDGMGGEITGSLEVFLYRDEADWNPLAAQYFQDDEWQLRAPVSDGEGNNLQQLSVNFTQYEALEPGQTVYAEIVLDGWLLEDRLEVVVPGPLMSVAGIIESESGGFQYPDGSIQNTAGITVETDPTVPAYLLDGIQWGEVSDRPVGLDDGDDDTTYSAGTGLVLENTTFRLDEGLFDAGLFWKLDGNAAVSPSQFLGTTDNQALELRVNGGRALRLEPGSSSPNVLGGYALNTVTDGAEGATVSGGGRDLAINHVSQGYATIGGGAGNTASGYASTIGGGEGHDATGSYATVGGGAENLASGNSAVISGGRTNQALGSYASVGGGQTNIAGSYYATVSGGVVNTASGSQSTIGGGAENIASEEYATVGGGRGGLAQAKYAVIAGGGPADEENPFTTVNRVTDDYGMVGGGGANRAGNGVGTMDDAPFATVTGGFWNTANSSYAFVGGGNTNTASGNATTIAGGEGNSTNNNYATVSGGFGNSADSQYATVSGGRNNTAGNTYATVGGGYANTATGALATVPGGAQNTASGNFSLAAGQGASAAHTGSFVWSDADPDPFSSTADNQFLIRAAGGVGIGTNSPSSALQVVGETSFKGNARVLGEDDLVSLGSVNALVPGCNTADLPAVVSCLQTVPAISVVGNTAFVIARSANTLAAFDVTDPQNIRVKDMTTANLHGPHSVVANGRHVYVANEYDNLLVVFETSPVLRSIGAIGLPGAPEDVFVSGNYAYLTGSGASPFLAVVDISDPFNPVVRSFVLLGGRSVHVSGDWAYVAATDGLDVYDVSDPDEIVHAGSASEMASSPSAIYVSGNRAFVTMESSNALVIYDIANPGAPVALGSSPTGSLLRPVSVMVSGDHAFVACEGEAATSENNGVVVFDVSDPADIAVRGTTTEEGQKATALAMAGEKVFVASRCIGACAEDDRFLIYEFNHLKSPALQTGNLQAGYLDVVESASVANGLNVGGGLNAGQAYVGGDLGVGGDLRMLGSIGGEDDIVCTELAYPDGCNSYAPLPILTFTNDIFVGAHWIRGSNYPLHCSEGQYLDELECCGFVEEDRITTHCLADVTPVGFGANGRAVIVDGTLVPACDAGDCTPAGLSRDLGHPSLRWGNIWAANGVIQTSDGRLKGNVTPLAYGMADLARLEPVSFAWKDGDPEERHLGLIAQEVRKVLPELVHGGDGNSDILGLNYGELVPVLISAVKELSSQVSDQASTIETLKERLIVLEKERMVHK